MRAVLVVAPLLLIACADQPSTSSGSQSVTTKNRLATNRLATNRLATNRLATNRLATNRLATNRLATNMLSAADLLSTPDGRTVYSYLISCAVPADLTLEADIPGAANTTADDPFTCVNGHCSFPGGVGLAPEWLNHRLDRKGEEWVSSCVFARCNAHDTAEAISLRGKSSALSISADEASLYTVEEGAFYGNLFTDDDSDDQGDDDDHKHDSSAAAIAWFACEGEGQASGEFGGLVVRDCTEPMACKPDQTCDASPACVGAACKPLTCGNDGLCHDDTKAVITQCGFNWAGFCADYTPQYPSPYACKDFNSAGGYYGDCHDSPGQGKWKHIKKWDRVITTYVTP
ncbi:MAG: hypothetical protein JO257_18920 [Deltaproteobacteria bacterium]|nr:hypothetical protein [Deltaproteobacteria bacterium]